jgi:WD40 repeat protein
MAHACWDVASGELVQSRILDADELRAVAYSRDEKLRLETQADEQFHRDARTLLLRDVMSRKVVSKLALERKHAEEAISTVAMSPDGRFVVAGGTLGTLNLWDGATGKLRWKVIDDEVEPSRTLGN